MRGAFRVGVPPDHFIGVAKATGLDIVPAVRTAISFLQSRLCLFARLFRVDIREAAGTRFLAIRGLKVHVCAGGVCFLAYAGKVTVNFSTGIGVPPHQRVVVTEATTLDVRQM